MSIPKVLCYQKVCTLFALSLIRHCSGLSITPNKKIQSENKTEALSNSRGIMIHIQVLSELSWWYLSRSVQLRKTDDPKRALLPPRSFPQQCSQHTTNPSLLCRATASVAMASTAYSPWRVDVDDILRPALQVSCCLPCKEDFEYWLSCTDDSVLGWKRSRGLFQLLADGNLYCTFFKQFQDLHN